MFAGLLACGIAAIRGRGGIRLLVCFGIFAAMYGARLLVQTPAVFSLLPLSTVGRPIASASISYLIIIPALLFWLELCRGSLRRFLQIMTVVASILGVLGIGTAIVTGSPNRLRPYDNLLVVLILVVLGAVITVPALATRFGVLRNRVSRIGVLSVVAASLYGILNGFLGLPEYAFLEPLAFAVFIFSLGYVAADKIFADERRLLSIENELAIARDIQKSILPTGIPEIKALNIHAAYLPMTAVAGDFYEFLPVDRHRVGILVADVSGHGVPAALIAAMIKVAMQSLVPCAPQPEKVLRGLNQILAGQLRGKLISAAYLWLDMESSVGLYSAAGHPPLLCWREDKLQRIESNGLLIGVLPDCDYPVCEVPFQRGDRFLLYTDGVVEPENSAGDAFGDYQFEQIIRNNRQKAAAELSDDVIAQISRWQPASITQQDDITLVIIDVANARSDGSL